MFRILPSGHVEKAPFALHIPNQPANSVRHASVLVVCSCRHDIVICIAISLHYYWKLDQATSRDLVGGITKNLIMLVL